MGTGDDRSDVQTGLRGKFSLNELTRLAHEHLQKGNPQKAMEHFESAVEQSKGIGDDSVKISCYLNAGACLVSLRDYKKGLSFLESAANIVKTLLNTNGDTCSQTLEMSADVFYNTAVAAQGLHEYDEAVSNFQSSIDLYVKAGSKQQAAEAFLSLASCHKGAGEAHKEIACLTNAQLLYSELEDYSREALVNVDLAKAYLSTSRQEDCKRMLSIVRMMCLRVDEPRLQGKLQSQLGLVYTSLGMFDEAIQRFERALPLVRVGKSATSLQMEASIMQNIGAAYNEKGLFSEGVVYHREAATLHGKTKNYNSEAKCLCNLAFAQTQLKDFPAAAESYACALERAQSTGNAYLQFQACEGTGAAYYQMQQHSDAIRYFNQAILSLDEIKQDTGIARERVMEKLSDAMEALQLSKQAQVKPRSKTRSPPFPAVTASDSERSANEQTDGPQHQHGGSSRSLQRAGKSSPKLLPRRLSPELNGADTTPTHNHINLESLPLPEKRGGFLPPLDPSRSLQLTAEQPPPTIMSHAAEARVSKELATSSEDRRPSHKHAIPAHRKGKERCHLPRIVENGSSAVQPLDSYDRQLQAYVSTLKEVRSEGSSLHSSSESSLSSGGSQDSGDQLGASMFSRHGSHRSTHKHHTQSPKHSPSPPSVPAPLPSSPLVVQEGSLAIGPDARERFTTQTHVVTSGQRRRSKLHTEIVPRTDNSNREPSLPHPTPLEHPSSAARQHQSKVCLIL